jgi:serine/threonine-protein kinase
MGEVYRARDTRLERDVAIKVLPDAVSTDARALSRFEQEAKAVAALSHPNILALHDVGREGAVSFVVTELLEGETLRENLARGPLPLRRALDVGLQVAEGLAAAHGKGIVHRDVKPENVFLTKDGHAKLLDFGLARSGPVPAGRDETQSPTVDKLTSGGVVVGTVAYMSPEQARGQTVDFRSDQFSLGIVLYEMLTGKRPFGGASAAETLTAIIREEPEPVTKLDPKLPALVGWIVQRCLSKEPEERYSSTKDLAKELQNLRTRLSEAVSAANIAPGEGPRLRRRVPYWALAAASLAAVLGVFAGIRFSRSASPPASPLKFSLSFPVDAAPRTREHNPFALSPDGRTLVFEGVFEGGDFARSRLFVRRLDLDEIRPIPGTDGTAYFVSPFMSPDGLEVGFFAEGKLKKVSLAGGSPITLCDAPDPRGGSWGADGTIVFVPSPTSGLWRIPASGGEPRRVTNPDTVKGDTHGFPQILPDGEHVLFTLWGRNSPPRAAVISLRTGEQRIVLEDARRARYLPTGHLVFARPGTLLAVPFSLKRLETSGSPVPVLEGLVTNSNFTQAAEYAFSQEGTLVYAASRQLQRTLVWVDRKGMTERAPFPPGGYAAVALSPDGGRLAAITVDKDEKQALVFGDFDRRTLSRSAAEGTLQGLAWPPDGKHVAFGFGPGRTMQNAFWQSTDGSTPPERLTSEAPLRSELPFSFSPDGSLLLVGTRNLAVASPHLEIFALPLNGERTLRPFLQTRFSEQSARFSPDGRWVAYLSNESGRDEVFVRPYPGPGGEWQISTEGGDDPCWSRSGRELFYWQGDNKMMVVDVETKPTFRPGRPRLLFEGRYFSHGVNFYDVTSDGTRFLMIKEDPAESGPAQVKVVLNWFEEVKRRVPGAK